MSEIVLVTQNDEPALAFGEYEISADGNTLYVGSAGVGDGGSEVIYKGISPAQVKYGVFSRLQTINLGTIKTSNDNVNINNTISTLNNVIQANVLTKTQSVLIKEDFTIYAD